MLSIENIWFAVCSLVCKKYLGSKYWHIHAVLTIIFQVEPD